MKEVTEWNGKPRMMWVWNDNTDEKQKEKVIYICSGNYLKYNVMTVIENDDYETFQHCAEIEEPKKRRMTNQELCWWLLDGVKEGKHREWKLELEIDPTVRSTMNYSEDQANNPVKNILIRENGGEWHEPLVEVKE